MEQITKESLTLKQVIHRRIFYSCCLALVFFIPVFGRMVPPIIALMVLNWLVEGSVIWNFKVILKESGRKKMLLFSLFYLIYVIGIFYSDNMDYGWFDLEIKFSMLLFPLIFASVDDFLDWNKITFVFKSFIAGSLAGTIILTLHAIYSSFVDGIRDSFAYTNLSWLFHPSYMSMYLSFAISIMFLALVEHWENHNKRLRILMISMMIWFFLFILFLSSKAGFIGFFAMLVFCSLILGLKYRRWLISSGIMAFAVLLFFIGLKLFPYAAGRISQANNDLKESSLKVDQGNNTTVRPRIWQACLKIIKRNPVFGVGTGDVKDELLKEYKTDNIQTALDFRLNAHNQYLQTFVALGISGFILLVAMLLIPAIISLKEGYYLYFSFLLIVAINFLVESMLEIQQGVVFYAFFNVFLFNAMAKKETALAERPL